MREKGTKEHWEDFVCVEKRDGRIMSWLRLKRRRPSIWAAAALTINLCGCLFFSICSAAVENKVRKLLMLIKKGGKKEHWETSQPSYSGYPCTTHTHGIYRHHIVESLSYIRIHSIQIYRRAIGLLGWEPKNLFIIKFLDFIASHIPILCCCVI